MAARSQPEIGVRGRFSIMAFGKRGIPDLELQGSNAAASRSGAAADWSLSRGDIGMALGVALVVFSGVCLFAEDVFTALRPADADGPLPVAVFAYDPAQFDRSYGQGGQSLFTADNPTAMMLTMTTTSEGFDAIDSELQERCLKPLNGNAARYAEENGRVLLHPQTGARLLACSMQVFRGRLCEAPYRDRLVANLQEFVRAQRAGAEPQRNMTRPEGHGLSLEVSAAKTGRLPVQRVPSILAQQLRALSDVSLISQVDFEDDMPDELKPYLNVESGSSPCV